MVRCRSRRVVTLLLTGFFVVLLMKSAFKVKHFLEINEFHFFQFGSTKGQFLVDYISANLVVEYIRAEDDQVLITLMNNGSMEIPGENWSIFFSHASGFHEVAKRRFKQVDKSRVIIRHLTGWFYSLEPHLTGNVNTSFTPLKPNQTLVIYEQARLKSKSYAYPKWYVSGYGLEPRIIQSTNLKRSHVGFKFEKFSPHRRFDRNQVIDLNRSMKVITPTPLSVKNVGGEMKIDTTWRVAYKKDLQNEATFLAEKLYITTLEDDDTKTPLTRAIHLVLKDLSSHFTKFRHSKRLHADESYTIKIEADTIEICGQTSHGIFYGIQSLLSLLENAKDGLTLPLLEISDAPRFAFRGLMCDPARNFIDKDEVLKTIKLMAMYKLNKLHLHLTDDQGWRIEIPTLPELTEIGSRRGHDLNEERSLLPYFGFGPSQDPLRRHYYSVEDYRDILRQASIHHIEVIPEIDMPGHAHAAIQAMRMRYIRMKESGKSEESAGKFLLHDFNDTSWYFGVNEQLDTVVNPCMESTYTFVREIVQTIVSHHRDVQPLKTMHFGGDEVPHGALVKSPVCIALTKDKPQLHGNLKLHFMERIISICNEFGVGIQSWEDGLGHGNHTPVNARDWKSKAGIVVNAWKLSEASYRFANQGYQVVLTHAHHLYLDHPNEPDGYEPGLFWTTRYIDSRVLFNFMFTGDLGSQGNSTFSREESCRVLGLKHCIEVKSPENIIGMQASLWGEMIQSKENFEYMLCPRLLAFAERAWHLADWETAASENELRDRREADWTDFANTLGYKELPRLERLGIKYRLPVPGFRVKGNGVEANTEFPGSLLQYSRDAGNTWNTYVGGKPLEKSKQLSFSVVSHDLQRRGRIISLKPN